LPDLRGMGYGPAVSRLVAEALPRTERLRLIYSLHGLGLTDAQIGEVTAYSTYTASRLRASLGLEANPAGKDGSGSHS
jgi:hypothetical protein